MSLSEGISNQIAAIVAQAKQATEDRQSAALDAAQAAAEGAVVGGAATLLYSTAHKQANYRRYLIVAHWLYDAGKIVLRAAGLSDTGESCDSEAPPDPNAVERVVTCKAKAALSVCVLTWNAERYGAPPQIPNASLPSCLRAELLSSNITTTSIDVETNATSKVYYTNGVYVFLLHVPIKPGDSVPVPSAPPYLSQENNIPATNYIDVFQNASAEEDDEEEEG